MHDAASAWATVAARKKAFWRALCWGPVAVIAALALQRTPLVALVVILAWAGWVVVRSLQVEAIACPRCGNTLFRDGMFHNAFSSHCLHCRQEIGAPVRELFPVPSTHARGRHADDAS